MNSKPNALNDRFRSVPASLLVIVIFFTVGAAQGWGTDSARVQMQFLVTDGWGLPVRNALIQLIPTTGPQRSIRYPQERTLLAEPGQYTVIVDAHGFRRLAKPIALSKQAALVPLCVSLAPVESSEEERPPSLIGSVGRHFLSEKPVWVRLVGLYCDFNSTTLVDSSGLYSFDGLQPGRYHLMLFVNGELKHSRQVDVRALDTKVRVE